MSSVLLEMTHYHQTRSRTVREEFWEGDLERKMRLAIGAWCDLAPGSLWEGAIYGPVETDGEGAMIAYLARGDDAFRFFVRGGLDGPW